MTHQISAEHLTIQKIAEIIKGHYTLELSEDAIKRISHCREYLDKKIAESDKPIYGVTTGFGSLCKISISNDQLSQLQINLMLSHACGVGERVPNDIVKIMILLKVQSLSYGYSGVKLDTVERLIDLFNNDVYPVVYKQGSVGASGDLVPLAHLCLPIVGLGEVEFKGERMSGADLCKKMGWEPIKLGSKEGLALLNGTQNMSAHAVWALIKAEHLSRWADVIAAISLEAYDGRIEPFTHAVHAVRPHQGQIDTAARMRELLDGSELIKQPKVNVQDPYSFRCIPQVHGSVKDTIPTSQGQEDHVSMGANAGVKLCKVVENTERVLAIELFNAAQALEFRRPLKSSPVLEHVFADYRKVVPFINEDQPMYPHIAKSVEFLQNNKID